MSRANDASNCFKENVNAIDADKEPEKYNLYVGFYNLAQAVKKIEDDLSWVKHVVGTLLQ